MIKLFPKNEIYLLNKFHTAKDLKRNVPEGHCSGDIQPLQIRPQRTIPFRIRHLHPNRFHRSNRSTYMYF